MTVELRGGWRVLRANATLVKVDPKAEPWDPGKGVVNLLISSQDSGFPKGDMWYRLADPMATGKRLAEQIVYLKDAIKSKRPVVISEIPGRICKCGRNASSPFCPVCGEQVYANNAVECQAQDHGKMAEKVRHCPFCGRYMGEEKGLTRAETFRKRAPD